MDIQIDLMVCEGAICSEHKIAEDLQGAWGRYSVAMETQWYKNGTCLLIITD